MKTHLIASIALCFVALASAQQTTRLSPEEMHRLHQNSKAYIAFLDDPARDEYQKPHEVIMALDLKEGERIADIGAGSGYFTFRLARHVGSTGRVYAVDINPDMIIHMNRIIRDRGIENVTTILAPPDDPLLPDHSIDLFFICDTWHHIQDKAAYLALMKRMLRPNGQIVMIDFQKRELPVGPPAEMKIAKQDLIAEMRANGFELAKEHTFLPDQYFLVFRPAADGSQ